MNQVYRIGDRVVIYGIGKLVATDRDGDLEIEFCNGRGQTIGIAFAPKDALTIMGEDYMVHRTGVVVGVSWSFSKRAADYNVMFEDERGELQGFATVQDSIMTPPAEQVLKQSEIQALEMRGIRA